MRPGSELLLPTESRTLLLVEAANRVQASAVDIVTLEMDGPPPCPGSRTEIVGATKMVQSAWCTCRQLQPPPARMGISVPRRGTQMKSIKFTRGRRWRRLAAACGRKSWPPWRQLQQRQLRPLPGTPAIVLAQPMGVIG